MPLRGSVTFRMPIPGEAGEWVELRMLGWRALETARQTRQINALKQFAGQGDALSIATSLQRSQPTATGPTVPADPLNDYDLATLLIEGVVAWSYAEPGPPAPLGALPSDPVTIKVTQENLERLDERTAKWMARQLIDDVHEPEGKGSNGSVDSTSTLMAVAG